MQTLVPCCTSPSDAPRFPTATRRVHLSQPVNVRGQRTSPIGDPVCGRAAGVAVHATLFITCRGTSAKLSGPCTVLDGGRLGALRCLGVTCARGVRPHLPDLRDRHHRPVNPRAPSQGASSCRNGMCGGNFGRLGLAAHHKRDAVCARGHQPHRLGTARAHARPAPVVRCWSDPRRPGGVC
jgi:hypothetical protein